MNETNRRRRARDLAACATLAGLLPFAGSAPDVPKPRTPRQAIPDYMDEYFLPY